MWEEIIMIDYVEMKLEKGSEKISLILGQEVIVYYGDMGAGMPMRVVRVYPDGDFDGEVRWEEG